MRSPFAGAALDPPLSIVPDKALSLSLLPSMQDREGPQRQNPPGPAAHSSALPRYPRQVSRWLVPQASRRLPDERAHKMCEVEAGAQNVRSGALAFICRTGQVVLGELSRRLTGG
jgi:hypothetical protein